MSEAQIQAKIIEQLTKKGWLVVKLISTNLNGIPDLLALKNGRAVFIEVKTETGKVSKLQQYRHQQIQDIGFEVRVEKNHFFCNEL